MDMSEARGAESGWLDPGVVVVRAGGEATFADERARELVGAEAWDEAWSELRPRLESGGLRWQGTGASGTNGTRRVTVDNAAGRALTFDFRADPQGGGVLLVRDCVAAKGAEADLRMSSLMRSLTQITPAVAHDLRAPINAMVFNIEVLKETIASGRGAEPPGRERQLRYVNVLKEELHRLHQGMETYIAQISPRADRDEILDLREPLEELAALLVGPARKQQARVETDLPSDKLMFNGNRYLLRQALLHVGLAALGTVARDGILEVSLEETEEGRARIRLAGVAGAVAGPGPDPAPGFEIRTSEKGTQAQLWVARAILAAQRGEVRVILQAGGPQAYEIDLSLQDAVPQEKE